MPSQLTGNSAICLAECSEGDNKGKHQSSIVLAFVLWINPWWRHQMETFSALLALCVGNSPITGEFPTQRPVTRSFDVFFALRNGWVNNGEAGDFKSHRAHYECHCNAVKGPQYNQNKVFIARGDRVHPFGDETGISRNGYGFWCPGFLHRQSIGANVYSLCRMNCLPRGFKLRAKSQCGLMLVIANTFYIWCIFMYNTARVNTYPCHRPAAHFIPSPVIKCNAQQWIISVYRIRPKSALNWNLVKSRFSITCFRTGHGSVIGEPDFAILRIYADFVWILCIVAGLRAAQTNEI